MKISSTVTGFKVSDRNKLSKKASPITSNKISIYSRTHSNTSSIQSSNISNSVVPNYEPYILTEEEKLAYMLGKTTSSSLFSREHICGACGTEHPNPILLDMYGTCIACHATLREPYHLRRKYEETEPKNVLEILFATYGDPYQPMKAIDVTIACEERVQYYLNHDRLAFRAHQKINELLGCEDPSVGNPKQLRIRYRMLGLFGTLILETVANNTFPTPIVLICPKERFLKISRAVYGHPKGRSSTGAMSTDVSSCPVTEIVQGFIDILGGSYLSLSHLTPLTTVFGDPCPGYTKNLRIEYEVCGRTGRIVRDELRGHLKKRVYIEESPTVGPLIIIESATYGITPIGRRERLRKLEKKLHDIKTLEYKLLQGLFLTPQETALVKFRKQPLLDEIEAFRNTPTSFIDVTSKLQILADKGNTSLRLHRDHFDPNEVFGNPLQGQGKLLEVKISCHGHDSEKWTDSKETTTSGHPRNFITNKSASFIVPVVDDPLTGRGRMQDNIEFETSYSAPIIQIIRATYGNFQDITKMIDCTSEVQNKVNGPMLCIEESENLNQLFSTDPCPGISKQLVIEYVTRGFTGNVRVREKEGLLEASINLGYMPNPAYDA